MHLPDIIIAIDGYSSTGKSSFAKRIASEFSFLYLDSGALYRAVTLCAIRQGLISSSGQTDLPALMEMMDGLDVHFEDNGSGSRTYIGTKCVERNIRTMAVSGKVSHIAALPQVREFVDGRLRQFGLKKRVVMDGRDIGTTVFPNAELKIFMTADVRVRAERRAAELLAKGEQVDMDAVLRNLQERDYLDSHRETSPLVKAPDAVVLDNSHMTPDDQMVWFRQLAARKFNLTGEE